MISTNKRTMQEVDLYVVVWEPRRGGGGHQVALTLDRAEVVHRAVSRARSAGSRPSKDTWLRARNGDRPGGARPAVVRDGGAGSLSVDVPLDLRRIAAALACCAGVAPFRPVAMMRAGAARSIAEGLRPSPPRWAFFHSPEAFRIGSALAARVAAVQHDRFSFATHLDPGVMPDGVWTGGMSQRSMAGD
jgi:hypothetical protein